MYVCMYIHTYIYMKNLLNKYALESDTEQKQI